MSQLLAPTTPPLAATSARRLVRERFREDGAAMFGLVTIVVLVLLAIFGGPLAAWVTGHLSREIYNKTMLDPAGVPRGPNSHLWFGADSAGRDVFVRTMYGARVSLLVGIAASLLAVAIGLVVGLIAGFFGGYWDSGLSRAGDVMLSLPSLLIAIGIVAACSLQGCLGGVVEPGVRVVIG